MVAVVTPIWIGFIWRNIEVWDMKPRYPKFHVSVWVQLSYDDFSFIVAQLSRIVSRPTTDIKCRDHSLMVRRAREITEYLFDGIMINVKINRWIAHVAVHAAQWSNKVRNSRGTTWLISTWAVLAYTSVVLHPSDTVTLAHDHCPLFLIIFACLTLTLTDVLRQPHLVLYLY